MKRSHEQSENGRGAPLIVPYRRYYDAFSKTYKRNIGFVLLIQIGKFLEAYDDSAVIISKYLSMALGNKKGADWTGFPIGSADKHVKTLASHGFSVIQIIQTENKETKKKNGSNSTVCRIPLPGVTFNLVSDQPLAIVQGSSILFYFSETNTFVVKNNKTNDELLCQMMQYEPCEIIIDSDSSFIKSIRNILPKAYIRQFFDPGFSAFNTLQKYMTMISQTKLLESLKEKQEIEHKKVKLDTRTIINLSLFGKGNSLFDSILPNGTTPLAKEHIKKLLFNPFGDKNIILDRQCNLKKLMRNDFLDCVFEKKPTKNLPNNRHLLFKTNPNEFVTTFSNIQKYLEIIKKTISEIKSWKDWAKMLSCYDFGIHIDFPPIPDVIVMETSNNTYLEQELAQFNSNHSFDSKIVASGIYKHMFETCVSNEKSVRACADLTIQSKTKKIIRFDSLLIQNARLRSSDLFLSCVLTTGEKIIGFLKLFQQTFSPLFFEQFTKIESFIGLAYFYKHCPQKVVWPVFNETNNVEDMELPLNMTNKQNWVANNYNDNSRIILLFGANGSGKTTYMRTLAINLLLAHCGLPVFASTFETTVLDAIFMRIGSNDSMSERKSSFEVELEHMGSIASIMSPKTAVFIDELGCSCDTTSGKKICDFFIKKIQETNCLCVFATHFDIVSDFGYEMGIDTNYEYTYKIQKEGINTTNNKSILIAERCGIPANVLYHATQLLLNDS